MQEWIAHGEEPLQRQRHCAVDRPHEANLRYRDDVGQGGDPGQGVVHGPEDAEGEQVDGARHVDLELRRR